MGSDILSEVLVSNRLRKAKFTLKRAIHHHNNSQCNFCRNYFLCAKNEISIFFQFSVKLLCSQYTVIVHLNDNMFFKSGLRLSDQVVFLWSADYDCYGSVHTFDGQYQSVSSCHPLLASTFPPKFLPSNNALLNFSSACCYNNSITHLHK